MSDAGAAATLNAVCPRCGGGFHCGARDAHCPCFDMKLGDELRAQLKAQFGGADCLCIACLVELKAAHAAPIGLRPMTEQDLPLFQSWLARPHVSEWWGEEDAALTPAQFAAEYSPQALALHQVTPYIAMLGTRTIGFAQSYIALGSGDGWWAEETDPGVRGIDQFLCEPGDLGRGLGTRMVKALVAQLFADPAVTKIQTDPDPSNGRAIRCYEKASFRRVAEITTPDGPAVYMICERDAQAG